MTLSVNDRLEADLVEALLDGGENFHFVNALVEVDDLRKDDSEG